jgi:hypothetical protein
MVKHLLHHYFNSAPIPAGACPKIIQCFVVLFYKVVKHLLPHCFRLALAPFPPFLISFFFLRNRNTAAARALLRSFLFFSFHGAGGCIRVLLPSWRGTCFVGLLGWQQQLCGLRSRPFLRCLEIRQPALSCVGGCSVASVSLVRCPPLRVFAPRVLFGQRSRFLIICFVLLPVPCSVACDRFLLFTSLPSPSKLRNYR